MPAIKVENLYKQYQLGQVSTGTVANDFNRWLHKIRGKEDPYEKITVSNSREEKGSSKYVWALEDINFEVKQGQVLGIIGRNGAGKSTLLKILSKVTAPTKGQIKIKGRIASLLEVGTGFHPELTGRENIFLNGAILGMTKNEIKSKFDEIVAFSGVEKYIDTPVKRYSSGMYVRLAFAVAAHLEPEILVIDEVLAVGDAEFQKKCLGKMKDVSNQGRTVLFVSHNMGAIEDLCNVGLYIERGRVVSSGICKDVVTTYLNSSLNKINSDLSLGNIDRNGNGVIKFESWCLLDNFSNPIKCVVSGQDFKIKLDLKKYEKIEVDTVHFSITITDYRENILLHLSNSVANGSEFRLNQDFEIGSVICEVFNFPLQPGSYIVHLFCSDLNQVYDEISFAGEISVEAGSFFFSGKLPPKGTFLVQNNWKLK
jgi:lipopolysaccharide transport system ATP-binding protein